MSTQPVSGLGNRRPAAVPERLETPRLLLSRPTAADRSDLLTFYTDPRVMATLGGLRTPDELDAVLRRLLDNWERVGFDLWVARQRSDGQFVGRGGLRRIRIAERDEVEVGYGLVPDFWGQGLAVELARESVRVAFGILGLADLISFTLPTNLRSRRVMEKVGFRYERDGEHAGLSHVFCRLRREDWSGNALAPG
jgi:[ribosomal protein S5]-alanine N-acetyltransferase